MLELLLLADMGDVLKALLFLVPVILWLYSMIAGANKQEPPAGQRRQPQGPQRAQGQQPPQPQNPDLRDEIEKFLKQTKRAEQEQPRAQPVEGRRQPRPGSSGAQRPKQPKPSKPRVVDAQVIDAVPVRETIASHVQHLSSHLAPQPLESNLAMAEERVAEHVHKTFDHDLGHLSDLSAAISDHVASTEKSPGAMLAAAMSTPEGVRNAIIFAEIMQRPSFD